MNNRETEIFMKAWAKATVKYGNKVTPRDIYEISDELERELQKKDENHV